MNRVVLDPNVLVSAIIGSGAPAAILEHCRAGAFEMVVSPALLRELGDVLVREKFRRYLSEEEAQQAVAVIDSLAMTVADPPDPPPGLTPDPDDDYLVALALAAGAVALVSGDPHLFASPQPSLAVLTPRAFLDVLDI